MRKRPSRLARGSATLLLRAAPVMMRTLSVVGIVAVFLVGGGIIAHSIGALKHWSAQLAAKLSSIDGVGNALATLSGPVFDATVGLLVGGACVAIFAAGKRVLTMLPARG